MHENVVLIHKYLIADKKEFALSKQLLRSKTAIGAMIKESQNAESKMDFIHKLSIAQKECDETIYWLELLKETKYLDEQKFEKINCSAILTTKQKILTKNLITHNS